MNGKILVTGASGFIGSHIVKILLENKRDVRVAVRDLEKADFLRQYGDFEIVQMDFLLLICEK